MLQKHENGSSLMFLLLPKISMNILFYISNKFNDSGIIQMDDSDS